MRAASITVLTLATAVCAYHPLASFRSGRGVITATRRCGGAPVCLNEDGGFEDASSNNAGDAQGEAVNDDERSDVEAFRAQMMRQMMGVGDGAPAGGGGEPPAAAPGPRVQRTDELSAGVVLVANPERFCSRNPFSRAVKDLGRFGLRGPIVDDEAGSDTKALMLPVLLLIENGKEGARALLMERRTGALMGDVSTEDYGCVAISPLWLGGTAKQSSLYVVHDVDDVDGASKLSDGLFLGGWSAARPRVADRSLAETRFKFFLGRTEWERGQLEEEVAARAWIPLACDPAVVLKDRVEGWRPGKPQPVWTELMRQLGDEAEAMLKIVYPNGV